MSFGWNIMFRRGAWTEFRRFTMLQRQNIPSRISLINREISRIGNIRVVYQRSDPENRRSPMSERRIGLEVNEGSTLCKLLQAYIARGGNPFDISMFLIPDSFVYLNEDNRLATSDEESFLVETQPYGGVVYPESLDNDEVSAGIDTSGWLNIWRYPARKLGSKLSPWGQYSDIATVVESARGWVTQEIRELRNDLEARIIKLCDLREQLLKERDEIITGAVGDTVPDVDFDPEIFSAEHHLFSIASKIESIFYELGEDGQPDLSRPREDTRERPYPVLLDDVPNGEENWTAIG